MVTELCCPSAVSGKVMDCKGSNAPRLDPCWSWYVILAPNAVPASAKLYVPLVKTIRREPCPATSCMGANLMVKFTELAAGMFVPETGTPESWNASPRTDAASNVPGPEPRLIIPTEIEELPPAGVAGN